jgi:hypothetical protein
MHRGRRAVCLSTSKEHQHIDHLLHDGFGVHIDGTRRRLARHRYGRLIRKGTERIRKRLEVPLEVGVMGVANIATRSRRTEQQRMQNA